MSRDFPAEIPRLVNVENEKNIYLFKLLGKC